MPLPTGYGTTREQRCWVHKTAHVLNKLPKGVQPRAKQHLQDIWMAETKEVAEKAFASQDSRNRIRTVLICNRYLIACGGDKGNTKERPA